jgi:hypothetical protein
MYFSRVSKVFQHIFTFLMVLCLDVLLDHIQQKRFDHTRESATPFSHCGAETLTPAFGFTIADVNAGNELLDRICRGTRVSSVKSSAK